MTTELRALSFWRPWTELVMRRLKPIENRGWRSPQWLIGGWLVMHGALHYDPSAYDTAERILGRRPDFDAPTGYLGVIRVTGECHRGLAPVGYRNCSCGPWAFDDHWHWKLARPLRFDEPIPGPGRQRLWRPPDDVVDAVNELLARQDT